MDLRSPKPNTTAATTRHETRQTRAQNAVWALVLLTSAIGAGLIAQRVKLPGGWLIGPLIVAVVAGLSRPQHAQMPAWAVKAAQAIIGVLLAGTFRPGVLPLLAAHWPAFVLSVFGVLAFSFITGVALARYTTLDRQTAALGTLPGGASGMISLSAGLGADTRMVALMQYIRLVLVVLSASLLSRFVLSEHTTRHSHISSPFGGPASSDPGHVTLVYVGSALLAVLGLWLGPVLRLSAGALFGPLILGLAASGFGLFHPSWPAGVPQAAYLVLGLYVGLLFDRASLQQAGRLVPILLLSTLALMIVCAALGIMLAKLTGADALTGYLATTPGGMDSITIVALGSGADVSLVLAAQVVRLLAIVLAGPALARSLKNAR